MCLDTTVRELAAPLFLSVVLVIRFVRQLVSLGNQRVDPRIPLGGLGLRRHGIMGYHQSQVVSGTFTDDFFGRGITGFSLETVEQTGKLMIAPLRYGQSESQSLSVGPKTDRLVRSSESRCASRLTTKNMPYFKRVPCSHR